MALDATGALAAAAGTKPIVFGQSVPLSGGSATLGAQLREGTRACFEAINAAGGLSGRRLELETLDDGYQPGMTLANTKQLAERCFAFTGYYGTPTVEAVAPFLEEQGIPMVGFVSGATSLRGSDRRMLFSVRASYDAEIAKMIEHNRTIGIERFAAIFQDDSFGKPCLASAQKTLSAVGLRLLAEAPIARNATDATTAASVISKSDAQAVLVFTTLQPTVLFVKAMQAVGRSLQYMVLSPIGADALSRELGRAAAGVGVAQVFPHPMSGRTKIVREYLSDLKNHSKESPGYYTLEGYINARVIAHAMRRISGEPSRAALHKALENAGEFDLGGFRLRYAPQNHQGSSFVELTVIGSGGAVMR
jgi:branched-chain amino acid transport system substrate-binding protein